MDGNFLWSDIVGQKDAIDKIMGALQSGESAHAWLFVGPRGVGKWTVAKALAAALNCDYDGCGSCASCDRIIREIHPDIYLIEPEGNFIVIDQVKQLYQSVSLKNYEGSKKVIIIDEADRLTPEAANSLLKTLEEPPPDVVFILVTANLEVVLPTIASRCRLAHFKAISNQEVISFLVDRYGLSQGDASLAARLSNGVLGAAISFAKSATKKERRKIVLNIAHDIDRIDLARLSLAAGELTRQIKKPLDELKEKHKAEISGLKTQFNTKDIPKHIKKRLEQKHKRELSREEHQGFDEILSILISWFRDIILLKEVGRENLLTNQDYVLIIKEHADILTSEDAYRCLEIVEKTRQLSRFNVNMQLAFEAMLFKIHEVVAVEDSPYFHQ